MDITLARNDTEDLSAERYLNLSKEEKSNIAHIKIIPPVFGKNDFGSIRVSYIVPIYKVEPFNE